jgi:exonuclease III
VNSVLVASLYAPNGNPQPGPKFAYKLAWLKRLAEHAADLYATGAPVGLPDIGIHGNSHYLMLEKNSMEIAGVVADWLGRRVTPAEAKEATTQR